MTDTQPVDVFGWLADREGCGTIRMMQPLDALSSEFGLNTEYNEGMSIKGLMPKIVVGQRVCKTRPTALWQAISMTEVRPKLVYEFDDDLWNIDSSNELAFNWFVNGIDNKTNEWHDVRNNIELCLRLADRVTVTTPALAELAGTFNEDVRIVPNFIRRWVTEFERPRRDRLTIGWMGSATHRMDWDQASSQIRQFVNRNPQVDFHLIGAEYNDWLKLPKDRVVETPWIKGVEKVWSSIDFDIGIAPLRPHVFNRSKSAIKFLEYSALGIPTVASDVGPYADNIKHGETGFLVKRDHEWSKYLRMLVNDEDMRTEMGANAHAWAKTQVLEDNVHLWRSALCEW